MRILKERKQGEKVEVVAAAYPVVNRYLNVFAACCIAVWYVYPKFSANTLAGMALFVFWAMSLSFRPNGFLSGRERLLRYLALLVWLAFVGVMIAVNTDDRFTGECKGIFLSIICLEVYRYYFDRKDFDALKTLCVVTLMIYMFTIARSLIIGGEDYGIYRQLTNFEDVGSFATYYTAVFTVPTGLYLLAGRGFPVLARAAGLALVYLSVMITLRAQFTIALILLIALTFVIWPFVSMRRIGRVLVLITIGAAVLICFTVGRELVSGLLIDFGAGFGKKSAFAMRITEIGYFIKGGHPEEAYDLLSRLNLYWASVVNFIKNPLLGGRFAIALGYIDSTSDHNSLMYTFEAYGLIPAICFFVYCKYALANIFNYWKRRGGSFYKLVVSAAAAYIMLSCLNPTFQLFPLTWVILFGTMSVMLLGHGQEGEL